MVQSVQRALELLRVVADEPRGLVDVAVAADLPLTTAFRLLGTLERQEAITRDDEGVYAIGPYIKGLAQSEVVVPTIQHAAYEELVRLADLLDEATCLSVPIGEETLTLLQVDTPRPVQAQDWTGHRWAITGGGAGAVMMASWPAARVEQLLGSLGPKRKLDVEKAILAARRQGVGWSVGTYVEGLSSVAAPIVDQRGHAIATIQGYGPTYRFPPKGRKRAVEHLVRKAAQRISKKLDR